MAANEPLSVDSRDAASIYQALLTATRHLTQSGGSRDSVVQALEDLASGLGGRWAAVFAYRPRENGETGAEVQAAWSAERDSISREHLPAPTELSSGDTTRHEQVGGQVVLTIPITTDERMWGGLQVGGDTVAAPDDPDIEEALRRFARDLGRVVVQGRTGDRADQTLWLRRRVQAEGALVDASRLLVSDQEFPMSELLSIIGEATEATYAYLVTVRPGEDLNAIPLVTETEGQRPPVDLDAYQHFEWEAEVHGTSDGGSDADDGKTFAVPILSARDQLLGYLGIEYGGAPSPLSDEDIRMLSVIGDMLCTYLQRKVSERALRRSEERYRHFVDTISEAIWRVECDAPISTDAPADAQVDQFMEQGTIVECNTEMASLFGLDTPEQLIGQSVRSILAYATPQIVGRLVASGYRLRNEEIVVRVPDGPPRHFVVNTTGVIEDGQLTELWGSSTEVTDRVELERRMVSALEQQQQRIGRDLHDSVGQLLTGIRMLTQNLTDRHFPDPDSEGHALAQKIIGYADEAAEHVSDLQRGLMPVQSDQGGLAQALKELSANTDGLPGIDCVYVHDGVADIREQEVKLQLYRIAQEATNNALKHADASYIKIALKDHGGTFVLEVEDDGVGFDPQDTAEESLGLHSMKYRARAIDATIDIRSAPGRGTTIRCAIDAQYVQA